MHPLNGIVGERVRVRLSPLRTSLGHLCPFLFQRPNLASFSLLLFQADLRHLYISVVFGWQISRVAGVLC